MGPIVSIVILLVFVAGMWMMFQKADKPGWYSLIPILNTIALVNMAGKPAWWVILLIVPVVSFFVYIILMLELAKAFGQGVLFAIGMMLLSPIFFCILGFGGATYTRPNTGVPA